MAVNRLPLADDQAPVPHLAALLEEQGIDAVIISSEMDLASIRSDPLPHLALVDISFMPEADLKRCVQRCSRLGLPVILLVPETQLVDLDVDLGVNDFVVSPPNARELVTRARRILLRTKSPEDSDTVRIGDLAINPTRYEVSLKGRRINLRFKEYELLRLLAANPGKVYTREALLSQIWGYDYFGGTRTVDVHIRRLRSKIEDTDHPFIETIWNVGYRFRDLNRPH